MADNEQVPTPETGQQEPTEETAEQSPETTPDEDVETQRRIDRAVTKALKTQRDKLEHDWEARLEAERKEAEQKALVEQGKWKELSEQKSAELDAIRAEAAARELRAETASALAERGLPKLAEFFEHDTSTLETRLEVADKLQEVIDARAEELVNARLKTPALPRGAQTPQATDMASRIKDAERAGDWKLSLQLKNEQMEAFRKSQGHGPINIDAIKAEIAQS